MVNTRRPRCSIVIRAYNEEKHIGRLLAGILEQTVQDVQIILVDSGSTDATIAIASRYPVEIIHIRPEEFTFGRSLNQGCKIARGEFIVFASAHVYPVYPDWLDKLLAPFDNSEVALVYGKQRGNQITKFAEQQIFAKLYPNEPIARQRHPFCNNANAAIRRDLWLQRKYDEDLPGLEDLDWARGAIGQGHVLAYSAEAEIIHVHDESPRAVYNRYRREAMALKTIQPEESFHFWDFLWLTFLNIVSDSWQALRQHAFIHELWGILWFRLMQLWGTYRGFAISGPMTKRLKETFYYPRRFSHTAAQSDNNAAPINYSEIADDDISTKN
jgi:glycosyltransferase involved in cell wall biosynthesis